MNPSDYRICLDVQAPHGAVELDTKQGDSQRRIFITLTDGGVPYGITEDCRPLLTAKKPDGTVLYNLCRVEQNTAIYPLTRQTTACPGRVRCELRLYSSSLELDEEGKPSADSAQLLTAATFTLLVHPQVCSDKDALSSFPESTQLEQLVTDTQALLTHVQTKLEQGDFVGEKGDKGDSGEKGEKGDKGEKGEPGEVNIDDGQVSEEATWSSMQISAEIADCVGYYPQNKDDSSKAQARENIGALGHTITKPVRISNGDQDAVILTAQTIFDQDSLMADVLTLQGDRDGQIDTDSVVLRGLHEGIQNTDAVNKGQLDKAELAMVDKLCPSFTETGALVTCQPVEGYPLTVTAEEGTTIARFGKNLVDTDVLLNTYLTKDENGIYHIEGKISAGSGVIYFNPPIPANTPVHFKFYNFEGYNANSGALLSTSVTFTDGTTESGNWFGVSQSFTNELTFKKQKAIAALQFYRYQPSEDFWCQFSAIQVEIGTTATAYEPYKSPVTYTADETGKVTGITGSGEVMNLFAGSGEITVTGKVSPAAEIEKLKNAILSLGGNL